MTKTVKLASAKLIKKRLKLCTIDYLNETSFHGFRYISHKKSSKFKSYFWLFVCLTSTCLCIQLIYSQFSNYYANRISTSILTTAFPIWDVAFPAVTVCNVNLVYKDGVEFFRKLLKDDFSELEFDNFVTNLSYLIPRVDNGESHWERFPKIVRFLERSGYNTDKLMSKLAHPCDKLLTNCYWSLKEHNCSYLFHKAKTNYGYCCSFNYKGILTEGIKKTYKPIFVEGIGPSYGLTVTLNPEVEKYVSPIKQIQGVEIAIHEPIQYPDMAIDSATAYPGHDISLSVKPEITESQDAIRSVNMGTRGCAFEDEIPMKWTNGYTYSTCISECRAQTILALCGCIPYYYAFRGLKPQQLTSPIPLF